MIKFNTTMMYRFLSQPVSSGNATIQIYDGEIPTVTTSFTFVPANYTPLATLNNIITAVQGTKIIISQNATVPFAGIATGTAKWFAIYNPGAPGRAVLGTITSDPMSPAAMLLDNINIVPTAGTTSFTIVDLGVQLV